MFKLVKKLSPIRKITDVLLSIFLIFIFLNSVPHSLSTQKVQISPETNLVTNITPGIINQPISAEESNIASSKPNSETQNNDLTHNVQPKKVDLSPSPNSKDNTRIVPAQLNNSPSSTKPSMVNTVFLMANNYSIYFGQAIKLKIQTNFPFQKIELSGTKGKFSTISYTSSYEASADWSPDINDYLSASVVATAFTETGKVQSNTLVTARPDPLYLSNLGKVNIRMGMNPDATKFTGRFTYSDTSGNDIDCRDLPYRLDPNYPVGPEVTILKQSGEKVFYKKYSITEMQAWAKPDGSYYFWYIEIDPTLINLLDSDFNFEYNFAKVRVVIKYKTLNQGEWSQTIYMTYNKGLGYVTWDYE